MPPSSSQITVLPEGNGFCPLVDTGNLWLIILMAKIVPFLTLLLILPFLTAGKRRESTLIGFHLQAGASDPDKNTTKLISGGAPYNARISPEFNQRDITGFYPFLSEDGTTFGTSFRLTKTARKRLQILSSIALGRRLFTVIDSNPIGFVLIDGPITHGYITCWKGLQRKHIEQFKEAGIEQIDIQSSGPSEKNTDRPAKTGNTR